MKHALTLFTALLFAPLTAFTRQRNPLRMIFVSLSLLMVCLAGSGNAMTFKPREVHQWDTWVFYHDQTYYLYYLIGSQWQGWDGVGVATSKDGVHWEERGTPIMKRDNANWLGTGSTWRSPKFAKDGRFIVNFSEQPKGEAQHIYFAESRDLLKWDRLPIEFRQDARWYEEKGRWDCIYPVARPAGGFYGYWTATPKGRVGFGFGESEDGVNWTALPAPELDWKTNVAPKSCEIGAVEKIGDKYYAMVGVYPDMLTFVAKQPQGPFVAAPKNFRLLVGNCYFARFFPSPDGLLVTHHSITKTKRGRLSVCYTVPLKRADVDAEGTLRLVWWRGNETLKGQATKPRIQNTDSAIAPAFLESAVDVRRGTMLEGSVNFKQAPGFVFESAGGTLTAIRLLSATATEAGPIQPDGTKFTALPGHSINRDLPTKPTSRWSLLFRHSLVELYLDDVLFNVLSLPEAATGRIGVLNNASGISDLKACTMTLPDEASPSAVPVAIQSAAKYNAVIKSQDKAVFGKAALELRRWMELHDPQRPVYHTMGPEAFTFDVNGPTYHDGRYHLFYLNQGGETKVCRRGHLTSPDLVHWEDWPVAMWPDTPWDHEAVFSGNLVIDDKGIPTFIYTGNSTHKTAKGVVARSDDGMLTWRKKLVMDTPPYPGTPVHWDGQLWKVSAAD
ncbi:MAG: hypothetical protein NTY19_22730 [Planctomycetota bacterium]|nr:hypothetical protein [Planctomycetota bacterium]